jgi:DNA end-binding protein Ku
MARPFWAGQIQISLVSVGVKLFPATEPQSEIHFHQLSRKTGERIHHQNVADDGKVDKDGIVKGYEYSKGKYIAIEPEEIDNLRIPSRRTLQLNQFVASDEIDPGFFEKPYFVIPEDDQQAEAFAVVRKALGAMKKFGLGKIAFSGREHLLAIAFPADEQFPGMMAYTIRYADELRDSAGYSKEIKKATVDEDQLSLAKELIQRKSSPFKPEAFKDEYEAALRKLVEAKVSNKPLPKEEPAPKSANVINLMDALRRSVRGDSADAANTEKTLTRGAKTAASRKPGPSVKPGPSLVRSAKATKKPSQSRKSA